jgi:hypothetical protein
LEDRGSDKSRSKTRGNTSFHSENLKRPGSNAKLTKFVLFDDFIASLVWTLQCCAGHPKLVLCCALQLGLRAGTSWRAGLKKDAHVLERQPLSRATALIQIFTSPFHEMVVDWLADFISE